MRSAAPTVRYLVRIGIFTVSLTLSVGWLAAPEALRAGRDAAAAYVPLPVEMAVSPVSPEVATRPTPEGGATALALAALLVLTFGFGVPRPADRSAPRDRPVGPRAALAFVPVPAPVSPASGRRLPVSLAFVLALGLFLGWMSAPDFVRHHEVSVAALGVATEDEGRASGSGVTSGLMDGFSSWIGPVPVGQADGFPADEIVFAPIPKTEELLDLEVVEDAETFVAEAVGEEAVTPRASAGESAVEVASANGDAPPVERSRASAPREAAATSEPSEGLLAASAYGASVSPASGTGDSRGASSEGGSSGDTRTASADDGSRSDTDGGSGSDPGQGGNNSTDDGDRDVAGPISLVDAQPVLGEIFVRFEDAAEGTAIADLLTAIGGEISQCFDVIDDCVVKVSTALDPRRLAKDLRGQPTVAAATPNWVRLPATTPHDPFFPLQWSLRDPLLGKDIGALGGWAAMGSAATKTRIAVLDTAVDTLHPDLSAVVSDVVRVSGGIGSLPDHGTNVAGVLAARGDSFGISGVNRSWAELYVFDVFSTLTIGPTAGDLVRIVGASDSHIITAIDRLPSLGIRVANMSFSGGEPSEHLCSAIARTGGVLFVAAAGNGGSSKESVYPANCQSDNVIAVASLDRTGQLAPTSNRGKWVEIAAPGELILTTAPGANYVATSGTSMAAPHVAGVASLMFAKNPGLDPATVRRQLMDRSDGARLGIGGGRLNACKALGGSGC